MSITPLPDKVPINMLKYPNLAALGKEGAGPIVSAVFALLDEAVKENYHIISEKYFGLPIQELMKELLQAMFDHKGIMEYLPNKTNGEAISDMYEYAVNPLHAAFTKEGLMNHAGEAVTFMEKFGLAESEFTVKKWMQGLLFYSYYCSLPDFARYLALDDYSLVDDEKHENIKKLIELRPVLDYQKRIGILPGKLVPGTGFFDAGALGNHKECPACQVPDQLIDAGITICINCKAAYAE